MENTAKLSGGSKRFRLERAKVKLLASYYGHPARDLKLIFVMGSTGKATTAHFVHEILCAANQPTAILASDHGIKATVLHKFLNDAWKAKVNYAVITVAPESLVQGTYSGLKPYAVVTTDFVAAGMSEPETREYIAAQEKAMEEGVEVIVLNKDDICYPDFAKCRGKMETLTYGVSSDADLRIEHSKLYRKGVEATLAMGRQNLTVASFLTGEQIAGYMAAAAAVATALNVGPDAIVEGIASYEK